MGIMSEKSTLTKVVIADDHPLFRSGIKTELETIEGLEIVGEAGDGQTALDLILKTKPDLAVLDVNMPELSGLDVLELVTESNLPTKVILLTMHRDRGFFLKALELGVRGYVLKDALVSEIRTAIQTVCQGQYYVSSELSGMLMERASKQGQTSKWKDSLTPSELKIITLVADLKTNQEIADTLFISKRTVENHRVNISRKLEITGTNALLKFAVKNKSSL